MLAARGASQLHVAETEKYAHVTYFFNGGEEQALPGEERALVPSPRDVPTYDLKPRDERARGRGRVRAGVRGASTPRFAIINFANADMVGHTGVIAAAVTAVETVDECLGRVVAAVHARGRRLRRSRPTTATPSRCSSPTEAPAPLTRSIPCR